MSQALSCARASQRAVEAVVRQIDEISTLPHVAIRTLQIANDESSGAADLTEAMEGDTVLSARVLRYVNSSAYAVRQRITNLQQAVAYLGMRQIRNLAITASVSDLFKEDDMIGPYRRAELWRHLVSVGICSRMMANRLGIANPEDLFLAGLLHDIGIILEDQYVHDGFYKVVLSLQEGRPLAASEREVLGFDHAVLGEAVGKSWGFPDMVNAAIHYHHMSASYRGKDIDAIRCVELANYICTEKDISSVGLKLVMCSHPALNAMKLTQKDVASLSAELDDELSANASLLSM